MVRYVTRYDSVTFALQLRYPALLQRYVTRYSHVTRYGNVTSRYMHLVHCMQV